MRNRTGQTRLQSSLVLSEVLTSMSSYRSPKCCAKKFCAMVTLSIFLLVSSAWMFLKVVDQNPYGFGWLRTVHWTPGTLQVDSYGFPINPMDTCKEGITTIKLLVLVKSAPSHKSLRDAIRETYASGIKEYNVSARVLFVLGNTEDEQNRKAIGKEAELYGDILQVDFTDHYYNLTIKLVMSFEWVVNFCRDTEFVMSIDDDVMLDVVTLVQDLEALPMERQSDFFLGMPNTYPPNRKVFSKWYIPRELYPEDTYPVSPFGHGYVMSQDVVQKLYEASKEYPPIVPFDDVYCGMLLQRKHIDIVNRLNFYKELHPKRRSKDYMMLELSEGAMKRTWASMRFGTLFENPQNFTCTNSVLFWLILLLLLIIIIVKYLHHASIDHQITPS